MDNSDQSSHALLDQEQIKMLLDSGADGAIDFFNEILSLFEEESRAKFDDMKASRDAGNVEAFSRAAHALAGSSANIGGRAVWLLARDMENHCKGGEGHKAFALLPQLEQMHEESLVQMRHYISQMQ